MVEVSHRPVLSTQALLKLDNERRTKLSVSKRTSEIDEMQRRIDDIRRFDDRAPPAHGRRICA